jgi:predicted esterase
VNGGHPTAAWFDIYAINKLLQGEVDHAGIRAASDYVKQLIQAEVSAGIPANRIVVAGFSQGGHLAYKTALSHPQPLAGCVALSTWLEPLKTAVPQHNKQLPIFVGHGTDDMLIPKVLSDAAVAQLRQQGCTKVSQHIYTGLGHSTNAQELDDVRDWLLDLIPEPRISREELHHMSVKELKKFLAANGVNTNTMLEKSELLAAALSRAQP